MIRTTFALVTFLLTVAGAAALVVVTAQAAFDALSRIGT